MLSVQTHADVSIIRLQHGKANALDIELLERLTVTLTEIETSETRALILTGTGSIFSAGVDLFRVIKGGTSYIDKFLPALTGALRKLFVFPKPVVAAVNGHAIAGGCILVQACDYRIMAEGTGKIGVPELLVGVPFPALPLEILRFALPKMYFQRLLYSGALFTAREAMVHGFVDESCEEGKLPDRALRLAQTLANLPQAAFSLSKSLVRAPTTDFLERVQESRDKEAIRIWQCDETLDRIRIYLKETVGRSE